MARDHRPVTPEDRRAAIYHAREADLVPAGQIVVEYRGRLVLLDRTIATGHDVREGDVLDAALARRCLTVSTNEEKPDAQT